MCKHETVMVDNGNSWCIECGASTGAIFKPEIYLEDEENMYYE